MSALIKKFLMRQNSYFKKFTLIVILSGFIISCSKNKNDNLLTSAIPAAQAVNDNKSGGIYKGTIVGSTGSFAIVLQDGQNKITLTLDGSNYTLTTQSTITSGTAISGANFTGSGMSMTFSVDANGNNPVITSLSIPNHPNAVATVLKETSTTSVMVFEGRYTKTSGSSNDHCSGTINFVVNGSSFIASYKEDIISNSTSAGTFSGTYSGNQINKTLGTTVVAVTISSNQQSITGSISDACSASVNCIRTM